MASITGVGIGGTFSPTVEVCASLAQLEQLATDWRALETVGGRASFFQSFDWCRYVWRTLAARDALATVEPRIVVVRTGERAVLIWPLAIRATAYGRVVSDLGEPFGQYSDALVASDTDPAPLLALAHATIERWRCDALILRKVRADAVIAPWLAGRASPIGDVEHAPCAALATFSDFAAYRNSLNAKTRKNLRNYRNRLMREGTLGHRLVREASERAELTRRCLQWRTEWLTRSGLSSTAFADPAFKDLVHGLATGERGAPDLALMHLTLKVGDGEPIDLAIQWGFIHAGRYYAFMSAKNPDYDSFSPGRLHLENVIETCAGEGVATVDFLAPDMPYKASLATGSVSVRSYGIAMSVRGRMLVHVWHGMARPALKRAYLSTPVSVRRLVGAKVAQPAGA